MGKNKVENVLRKILIPFCIKMKLWSLSSLADFTNTDRNAIKKYLELYVDLKILLKIKIKNRYFYTINNDYISLYKDNELIKRINKK